MREFIVEVPTTIRVVVDAVDADAAGRVAGKIVDRMAFGESLERVGGVWQLVHPELIPLDGEDSQPDVFICSGGKLAYITDVGYPEPTGEDCPFST